MQTKLYRHPGKAKSEVSGTMRCRFARPGSDFVLRIAAFPGGAMEIVGLGSQVMDCARVRKLIDKHGETFLRQVYTEREVRHCNERKQTTEQFTALWAAKEAVLRSLGTTWKRGTNW